MVGRIAETGLVAASDFRRGHRPPSDGNSGFAKRCMRALPAGARVTRMRIDAASGTEDALAAVIQHRLKDEADDGRPARQRLSMRGGRSEL